MAAHPGLMIDLKSSVTPPAGNNEPSRGGPLTEKTNQGPAVTVPGHGVATKPETQAVMQNGAAKGEQPKPWGDLLSFLSKQTDNLAL